MNTTAAQKTYHHGDVRDAAVKAGLGLLAERSAEGVSLREIARAIGVSQTAIYWHFPDKAALMRALAAEGLARLARGQRDANVTAGGGRDGFMAMGIAYVEFATDNPALFRLIFAHSPSHDPMDRELGGVSAAMAQLLDAALVVAPAGMNVRAFALHSWAVVHGLAMLVLERQVPGDRASIMAAIGAYADAMPSGG